MLREILVVFIARFISVVLLNIVMTSASGEKQKQWAYPQFVYLLVYKKFSWGYHLKFLPLCFSATDVCVSQVSEKQEA